MTGFLFVVSFTSVDAGDLAEKEAVEAFQLLRFLFGRALRVFDGGGVEGVVTSGAPRLGDLFGGIAARLERA